MCWNIPSVQSLLQLKAKRGDKERKKEEERPGVGGGVAAVSRRSQNGQEADSSGAGQTVPGEQGVPAAFWAHSNRNYT